MSHRIFSAGAVVFPSELVKADVYLTILSGLIEQEGAAYSDN